MFVGWLNWTRFQNCVLAWPRVGSPFPNKLAVRLRRTADAKFGFPQLSERALTSRALLRHAKAGQYA